MTPQTFAQAAAHASSSGTLPGPFRAPESPYAWRLGPPLSLSRDRLDASPSVSPSPKPLSPAGSINLHLRVSRPPFCVVSLEAELQQDIILAVCKGPEQSTDSRPGGQL